MIYYSNSTADQRLAVERMVYNEVVYCVSYLFDACYRAFCDHGAFGEDEKDLNYLAGGYEACHCVDASGTPDDDCDDCGGDGEALVEIHEHWIVSEWLASKLAAHGERTGDVAGLTLWGRGTTGQGIVLDVVIWEIASDAGLLD